MEAKAQETAVWLWEEQVASEAMFTWEGHCLFEVCDIEGGENLGALSPSLTMWLEVSSSILCSE